VTRRREPPIAMQQSDAMSAEKGYIGGPLPFPWGGLMIHRILITLVGGLAIAWPLASYSQEPKQPLKRVGFLTQVGCPLSPDNLIRSRLAELGWVEGRNFVFDCVSAVGRFDQLPELARELVSRRPDVVAAGPITFVSALKQATTTIPIVMFSGWEPVLLAPAKKCLEITGLEMLRAHRL